MTTIMACSSSRPSLVLRPLLSLLLVTLVVMVTLLTPGGAAWPPQPPTTTSKHNTGGDVRRRRTTTTGGGGWLARILGRHGGRGRTNLYAGVEPDQPVAFSSRQMAAVRALEAERSDRLFDDPLSALLAGEEAMGQARTRATAARPSQGIGRKIACRTRYFDDFLVDCSSSTGAVFMILGAGMDTRAYRLPLNGTVIEVDTHDVMAAKEALLKQYTTTTGSGGGGISVRASGGRVAVAADLGQPGWSDVVKERARGVLLLPAAPPLAVVMEGLTMYLNQTQVEDLMRELATMAGPGSRIGISLVDTRSLADAQASESRLRQAWQWGCDEDKAAAFFEGAFAKGGGRWKVRHVVCVGKAGGYPSGANYGCWRDVGRWKRKGKTIYVLADRVQ